MAPPKVIPLDRFIIRAVPGIVVLARLIGIALVRAFRLIAVALVGGAAATCQIVSAGIAFLAIPDHPESSYESYSRPPGTTKRGSCAPARKLPQAWHRLRCSGFRGHFVD